MEVLIFVIVITERLREANSDSNLPKNHQESVTMVRIYDRTIKEVLLCYTCSRCRCSSFRTVQSRSRPDIRCIGQIARSQKELTADEKLSIRLQSFNHGGGLLTRPTLLRLAGFEEQIDLLYPSLGDAILVLEKSSLLISISKIGLPKVGKRRSQVTRRSFIRHLAQLQVRESRLLRSKLCLYQTCRNEVRTSPRTTVQCHGLNKLLVANPGKNRIDSM